MTSSERRWSESELRTALNRYEEELRAAGKARNTITTYVQHPERFINWLMGTYRPRPVAAVPNGSGGSDERRSKYDPLRIALQRQPGGQIRKTFREIEADLGFPLPASARRYPAWWANEGSGTHVHARSWLVAGWKTSQVDLNSESVTFTK